MNNKNVLLCLIAMVSLSFCSAQLADDPRSIYQSCSDAIPDIGWAGTLKPTVGNDFFLAHPNRILRGSALLVNDDPGHPSLTLRVFADGEDIVTAEGGVVLNMDADGNFQYRPPPGFREIDSFDYFVHYAGNPGVLFPGKVFVDLSQLPAILYADNLVAAPGTGLGTEWSPYGTLSDAGNCGGGCLFPQNTLQPGDYVRVATTGTEYDSGIELLTNVKLSCGGVHLTHQGVILERAAAGRPTISNPIGVGIELSENNIVEGCIVSNTGDAAIQGVNVVRPATFSHLLLSANNGDGLRLVSSEGRWFLGPSNRRNVEIIDTDEYAIELVGGSPQIDVQATNIHSALGLGLVSAENLEEGEVRFDSAVNWFIDEFIEDVFHIHNNLRSNFRIEVGPSRSSCVDDRGAGVDAVDFRDNTDTSLFFGTGTWTVEKCGSSFDECDSESFEVGFNVNDNLVVDFDIFPSDIMVQTNLVFDCARIGVQLDNNELPISFTGSITVDGMTFSAVRVVDNSNEIEFTNTVDVTRSAGIYVDSNVDQVAFLDDVTMVGVNCTYFTDDGDGCADGDAFAVQSNDLDDSLVALKHIFLVGGAVSITDVQGGDGLKVQDNVGRVLFVGAVDVTSVPSNDAIEIERNIVDNVAPTTLAVNFGSTITMTDIGNNGLYVDGAPGDPLSNEFAHVTVNGTVLATQVCRDLDDQECAGVRLEDVESAIISFGADVLVEQSVTGSGVVIYENEDDADFLVLGNMVLDNLNYDGLRVEDNDDADDFNFSLRGMLNVTTAGDACLHVSSNDDGDGVMTFSSAVYLTDCDYGFQFDENDEFDFDITFEDYVEITNIGTDGVSIDGQLCCGMIFDLRFEAPLHIEDVGSTCFYDSDNDEMDQTITFVDEVTIIDCGADGIHFSGNPDTTNVITFQAPLSVTDVGDIGIELHDEGTFTFQSTVDVITTVDDGISLWGEGIGETAMVFNGVVTISDAGGDGLELQDDEEVTFNAPVHIFDTGSHGILVSSSPSGDFDFASVNVTMTGGDGIQLDDDGDVLFSGPVSITDTTLAGLHLIGGNDPDEKRFQSTLDITTTGDEGILLSGVLDLQFAGAVTISGATDSGIRTHAIASGNVVFTAAAPLTITSSSHGIQFSAFGDPDPQLIFDHNALTTITAGGAGQSGVQWDNDASGSVAFASTSSFTFVELDITNADIALAVVLDETLSYSPTISVGPSPGRSTWTTADEGVYVSGNYNGVLDLEDVDATSTTPVRFDADNGGAAGGGLDATDCLFTGNVDIVTQRHTSFTLNSCTITGTFNMDLHARRSYTLATSGLTFAGVLDVDLFDGTRLSGPMNGPCCTPAPCPTCPCPNCCAATGFNGGTAFTLNSCDTFGVDVTGDEPGTTGCSAGDIHTFSRPCNADTVAVAGCRASYSVTGPVAETDLGGPGGACPGCNGGACT